MVENVVGKHNAFITNVSKFKLCDIPEMVRGIFKEAKAYNYFFRSLEDVFYKIGEG